MRVLLVEDDQMVGRAVCRGLTQAGFTVDWAEDGRAAEVALSGNVYDCCVLDLGLPRKDGMRLLTQARGRGNDVPVLIASARDSVGDRIMGLEAGADDYLLKPFDLNELTARIRAIVRRHAGTSSPVLRHRSLVLDPSRKTVLNAGEAVELSAREFALLEVLMRRPGVVVSRDKLEQSVYGWGEELASNAIEVHLHHLRRKLGPGLIRNIRGVGYCVADD
jgi:two-component system response regulator QseB